MTTMFLIALLEDVLILQNFQNTHAHTSTIAHTCTHIQGFQCKWKTRNLLQLRIESMNVLSMSSHFSKQSQHFLPTSRSSFSAIWGFRHKPLTKMWLHTVSCLWIPNIYRWNDLLRLQKLYKGKLIKYLSQGRRNKAHMISWSLPLQTLEAL